MNDAPENNNDFDVDYTYNNSCNIAICKAIVEYNTDSLSKELSNPLLKINYVYPGFLSCLHRAVQFNNHEAIEMLVAHGADININTVGTPLTLAIGLSLPEVVELLVRLGADVNQKDIRGYSPLYLATVVSNTAIVKCLLENGAIPDSWNPPRPIDYLDIYDL